MSGWLGCLNSPTLGAGDGDGAMDRRCDTLGDCERRRCFGVDVAIHVVKLARSVALGDWPFVHLELISIVPSCL